MTVTILQGNCLDVLKGMKDETINCCVTSPPYWGLRDYKTDPIIWDAVEGCEHEWGVEGYKVQQARPDHSGTILTTRGNQKSAKSTEMNASQGAFCQKCGAWKGQLGLEPYPNLYIKHLCDIFDEVKRVLKHTGTCWVNMGDSYSGSCSGNIEDNKAAQHGAGATALGCDRPTKKIEGIKEKSLVQIPSRFAIEMTDRGWILRNEIIWHKPNCMPSSVSDRFTVDFEKIFFFVKNKKYYFKQQLEPVKEVSLNRAEYGRDCSRANNGVDGPQGIKTEKMGSRFVNPEGRNKRTVWTITTKPYKEAHFAVYPKDIPEICIKAGCPEDGMVLDPFGGSGTTGEVAKELRRNSTIIELNPAYIELIEDRCDIKQQELF
jgi:site-specific DNA-methyltransferase (adenine-specific)